MKKALLLSVLTLIGATAAQADANANRAVFNFSFFGNYSGNYTMVACDYAESVAQEWIEKLGAKNVAVSCTGGITPTGLYPLNLHAEYDAGTAEATTVSIESSNDSNCVFDTELMANLVRDLPNVKVVSKHDFCFSPDTAYSYQLAIGAGSR